MLHGDERSTQWSQLGVGQVPAGEKGLSLESYTPQCGQVAVCMEGNMVSVKTLGLSIPSSARPAVEHRVQCYCPTLSSVSPSIREGKKLAIISKDPSSSDV